MSEFQTYVDLCEKIGLEPVETSLELAALMQLSVLGPDVIPYRSPTGTIWVHNVRHKTKRKDRPFMVANMAALQEKRS